MHIHFNGPTTPARPQDAMAAQWIVPTMQYGYPMQIITEDSIANVGGPVQAINGKDERAVGVQSTGGGLGVDEAGRGSMEDHISSVGMQTATATSAATVTQGYLQGNGGGNSNDRGPRDSTDDGSMTAMLSSFFVGFLNTAPEYWVSWCNYCH
jgi:hypothetical protein